jgi:uridine phosphorylase
MFHARVRDPIFFRIGTCGGIGLEGGTVVISEETVDGMMQPYLELVTVSYSMAASICSKVQISSIHLHHIIQRLFLNMT